MSHELVIGEELYATLQLHLFQSDHDEHAAVILAGVHDQAGSTRLLARELHLVPAEQFIPGIHGYRQTSPGFVAELAVRAFTERLAYVALHSHPGATNRTALSHDDRHGHRRLFPHLLNLTNGVPVLGVALGTAAAAGEVWLNRDDPAPLDAVRVVGHNLVRLTDRPPPGMQLDPRFDRQARLFGARGQEVLRSLHVAVVGAGGGGSLLVEQLAHLGVGRLTVVDYDTVKSINLSRIVGSNTTDIGRKKVDVMGRLVTQIDPSIDVRLVDGDITDRQIAERLLDCDFIFLATDTITSRLVFNAIAHRYLIPGVQIGAKVDVRVNGSISQVYVAVRPVLPDRGCLHCNSLIDPNRVQAEARTEEEQRAQNYLNEPEVIDPSVISLNGLAAANAVNVMLFSATGLAHERLFDHRLYFPLTGDVLAVRDIKDPDCPFCSISRPDSHYGRGGSPSSLPCRFTTPLPGKRTRTRRRWLRFATELVRR
jgi:molybdopterin/thiamine biosynthesis adenylyltransferase